MGDAIPRIIAEPAYAAISAVRLARDYAETVRHAQMLIEPVIFRADGRPQPFRRAVKARPENACRYAARLARNTRGDKANIHSDCFHPVTDGVVIRHGDMLGRASLPAFTGGGKRTASKAPDADHPS